MITHVESAFVRWIRQTLERQRSGVVPSQKNLASKNRPKNPYHSTGTAKKSTGTKPRPTVTVTTVKHDALSDLLDLLGAGHKVPSQQYLADRWDRPKQTVSRWLREWRSLGIIPYETRAGRCKATIPA